MKRLVILTIRSLISSAQKMESKLLRIWILHFPDRKQNARRGHEGLSELEDARSYPKDAA